MKRNVILARGLAFVVAAVWTVPCALAAPNAQTIVDEASSKIPKRDSFDDRVGRSAIRSAVRSSVRSSVRSAVDSSVRSGVELAVRSAVDAALLSVNAALGSVQEVIEEGPRKIRVLSATDDGAGWLGVGTAEVTADKAKELKLSEERGVVLTEVIPDSPAAKAGLKNGDVVTEFNGQRVEGAAQFRRFIHETPGGRAVKLTIRRDGKAETISATLGKAEQRHQMWSSDMAPGEMIFNNPRMPNIEMPRFEFGGENVFLRRPILGISADSLSGQLGSYFGVPDGEGILVREVSSGSAAEKAGIKAGDVITKIDGDRVRNLSDLREKLSGKLGDKGEKKTVNIGLLRDRQEKTVNIELERPQAPKARSLAMHHRTI